MLRLLFPAGNVSEKKPQNKQTMKSKSKLGKVANTSENTGQLESAVQGAATPLAVHFVWDFCFLEAGLDWDVLLSNFFWKLDFALLKGI